MGTNAAIHLRLRRLPAMKKGSPHAALLLAFVLIKGPRHSYKKGHILDTSVIMNCSECRTIYWLIPDVRETDIEIAQIIN